MPGKLAALLSLLASKQAAVMALYDVCISLEAL